jgi:type VI secretion system protein ImpC
MHASSSRDNRINRTQPGGPAGVSILDALTDTFASTSGHDISRPKEWIAELVAEVLSGEMRVKRDTESMISSRIAELDHLISTQLSEVIHCSEFQRLESSWRGLNLSFA